MSHSSPNKKNHEFFSLYEGVEFTARCPGQGNAMLVYFSDQKNLDKAKKAFEKKYKLSLDSSIEEGLEHSIWLPTHLFYHDQNGAPGHFRTPESLFLEDRDVRSRLRFKHIDAADVDDLGNKIEAYFAHQQLVGEFATRGRSAN